MPVERDWDAIELDYRAGVLPMSAVARKHSISASQLKSHADKYLWERKPLDPFAIQQSHGIASLAPSLPKFGMDSNLDVKAVAQAQLLTAIGVIDIHRKDVKKLRDLSGRMAEKLSLFMDGLEGMCHAELVDKLAPVMALLGKDTPVDMLEKLSRIMVRLTTIERQAYGLDSMPAPNPDDEPAAEAVKSQVNELWQQVQELQKAKTLTN